MSEEAYDALISKDIIVPFTQSYTVLHKNLVRNLRLLDIDISSNISRQFKELQDEFTQYLVSEPSPRVNCFKMKNQIKDSNYSVMKALMDFHMRALRV